MMPDSHTNTDNSASPWRCAVLALSQGGGDLGQRLAGEEGAQVFATLNDSASRQFTGRRGALFWVALQGLDANQLMSVHEQDSDPDQRPTGLRLGVSNFLMNAPAHIVGVVFGSRSGLHPTIHGHTDTGGTTNFFLKEQSPYWHESFLEPLRGSGGTA